MKRKKNPQPLRIMPICHYCIMADRLDNAYLLISQIPISHHANQPSNYSATIPSLPPSLSLSKL